MSKPVPSPDKSADEVTDKELDKVTGGDGTAPTTTTTTSSSGGAGAGKITFNPFQITKQID
jgi:bacteriocin-like protein